MDTDELQNATQFTFSVIICVNLPFYRWRFCILNLPAIAATAASSAAAASATAAAVTVSATATTAAIIAWAEVAAVFFAAAALIFSGCADGFWVGVAFLFHRGLAAQFDAALVVDEDHLHAHFVADVDEIGDVLNVAIGKFGNVAKAVGF